MIKRIFLILAPYALYSQFFTTNPKQIQSLDEFEKNPNYKSEAYTSTFDENFAREDFPGEEYDFYLSRCPFPSSVGLIQNLKILSPIDSVFSLKHCSEIPESFLSGFEKSIKQKIYDLTLLPVYEEVRNPSPLLHPVVSESFKVWKKTVYHYSNFYKNELLFLEKERQFSNQLIRILYSEGPPSQKVTLLRRIMEDMRNINLAKTQMFLYSKQNPWSSKTLEDENLMAYKYYSSTIQNLLAEPAVPPKEKEYISKISGCISLIKDVPKFRLLLFYGFFSDYGRFLDQTDTLNLDSNHRNQRIFIKRTIFQSHHFSNRAKDLSETCDTIVSGS